jgi:hypothetical protein
LSSPCRKQGRPQKSWISHLWEADLKEDSRPDVGDLISDRVSVGALLARREDLNAAPELFEALAQNRPGYLKALLYPNGDGGRLK